MTKTLTIKQAKLVKAKAEGKTHIQAYKEVYSATASDATAVSNTDKILKRENVQEALQAELKRQGIDIETVVKPVATALKHEDLEFQLKGHDRAVKLMGLNQSKGDGGNININFNNVAKQDKDEFGI